MSTENNRLLLLNLKYNFAPINCAFIITTLIDNNIEYDFFDMQLDSDLEKKLRTNDYYAVAVGGLILNYIQIQEIITRIRRIKPDIIIFLGGRIIGIPPKYLNRLKVDFLIQEDANPALPNLFKALTSGNSDYKNIKGIAYRDNNSFKFTEPEERRSLTGFYPTWKDIDLQYYLDNQMSMNHGVRRSYPLIVGMGCVGRCVFCAPQTSSHRVRDVDSVISEIKFITQNYKVDSIGIMSEIFYNTVEDARKFSEEYLKAGINKTLYTMVRPDFKPEILEYLVKAGCKHIYIGVEAYHTDSLKKMGKGVTTKDVDTIVAKIKELGIQHICGFLIGNPGDTAESLDSTLDFFIKNKITPSTIGGNGVIIFPGTAAYRIALQKNLIADEDFYLKKLCNYTPETRLTPNYGLGELYPNITTLSNNELWEKYSEIYYKMYMFQMETFSAVELDWKTNTAVCRNCGEKINILHSPATLYICSNCFAPNFMFMHNLLLKQSANKEKIFHIMNTRKKVAISGTFNTIYVLIDLAAQCGKNPDDLLIIANGSTLNHFKAALKNTVCIEFSEISQHTIDAFIHYGLHDPEYIENTVSSSCGLPKTEVFNATPIEYKNYYRINNESDKFYFEYTFEEDLMALGERIGQNLATKHKEVTTWLLPSTDQYADGINKGIVKTAKATINIADKPDGAIITTPRLIDSLTARKELLRNTTIAPENILILKTDILPEIWSNLLIHEPAENQ